MKKSILFISILLIGVNNSFSQDTIPNPGFENWTGASPNEPVGWGTADAIQIQLSNCVTQATAPGDDMDGDSSAIILTTVQVHYSPYTWLVAGTAVSGGTINQTAPFVSGGIPYTKRPTHLNGFCKYLPKHKGSPIDTVDVCDIQVYFTKWNVVTLQRDTIGQGELSPTDTVYTAFTVPITFTTTATPDTAQIIFSSSHLKAPDWVKATKGSKLYVDSLSFDFIVGVEEFSLDKFGMKQNTPNPFSENTTIQFNCTTNEKINFDVIDILGREMHSGKINAESGVNTITYTTTLAPGTYFYSIDNGKNRITKRMVITE